MKRVFIFILKFLGWVLGVILILLLALTLVIKLPSIQTFIIHKATDFVSSKTKTKVTIGEIALIFPRSVRLNNVFAEDLKHDTLIYLGMLDVKVNLLSLIDKKIDISRAEISDLNANIYRTANDTSFNFQFIIDAFAPKSPIKVAVDTATNSKPWRFGGSEVGLKNVNVSFHDSLGGTHLGCAIGSLELDVEKLDIQTMQFDVNYLQLANTKGYFHIAKSSPISTITGKSTPLVLSARNIDINNVDFNFINDPSKQDMKFNVGKSLIKNAAFDLATLTTKVGRFNLSQSIVNINMLMETNIGVTNNATNMVLETEVSPFNIVVEKIDLQHNTFKINMNDKPRLKRGMDFQHLDVKNINLKANKTSYSYQNIKAEIENFTATDQSGFQVKDLATIFVMDEKHAELKSLYLRTGLSKISNYVLVKYNSWDDFSKNIGALQIDTKLNQCVIDLRDVLFFQPELAKIDLFKQNLNQPIKLNAAINGYLSDIDIQNLGISFGKHTSIQAKGKIRGLPNIKKTYFDVILTSLNTSHQDLVTFLPTTILSTFSLPDTISLKGNFKGTTENFASAIQARTSDGYFEGNVELKNLTKTPSYIGQLVLKNLNVGKILKQTPMLGSATLTAKINGQGFDISKLNAMVDTKIDSIYLNKYKYIKLNVNGNFKEKIFVGHADIDDPNLSFVFDGKLNVRKKVNEYSFNMVLNGADLQALNLTSKDVTISALAEADIKAPDVDRTNGNAAIKKIVMYSEGKKYRLDSIIFTSYNDDKISKFYINSPLIRARYEGNIAVTKLPAILTEHFNYYFKNITATKSVVQKFEYEMEITNLPIIYEVLVPSLKSMIPGKIKGGFDSQTRKLDFDANMIQIDYNGNKIDQLSLGVHSDIEKMDYSVGFSQFSNPEFSLDKTMLSGTIKNKTATIQLAITDKEKKNKLYLNSQIVSLNNEDYKFNILPKGFLLNDENWDVPESNLVEFGKNGTYIHNMNFENKSQNITINSSDRSNDADLAIKFKNFDLMSLSQILEKKDAILRGILDGDITLKKYRKQMAFVSDLNIKNTEFKGNKIGNTLIKADNLTENKYTLLAQITGNQNDILLKGYLQPKPKGMEMDLHLDLSKLNLASFQGFIHTQATSVTGFANGNVKITGQTSDPQINGDITLNKIGAKVLMLNQYLTLDESKIKIDPKGIYFPNILVYDSQKNTASIKGSIAMQQFKDMRYNIDIETDKFIIMNSTRKNFKMLNGKMIVSSTIKVRGTDAKPDIYSIVKLVDGSNFCFTIPENQLSADKGDGVIEFIIDTVNLHPIIRRAALHKKSSSGIKGIHITSNIELNKNSTLKLVLDPTQADTLIIRGDANLSFALDQSGKMSLTGTYIVASGSYELTLQDIVKKKFLINKGSTIVWNGDPLDANLDIVAQHNVRTSPADLLASGASGKVGVDNSATKNALNFFVKIFIKGQLLKPNLRFGLDMEPSQQQALGGTVYAKLNALNFNESERDKQVFSLLVLGSFMPTANSSGGGTDYSGIARSSASSILSSQLNALSAQYIKGVEVNFDLQSYNDYQSGAKKGNTQLSVGLKKRFFNDRLSVQIGSNIGLEGQRTSQNNASNFTGNMVVEYKLTNDGNYRLKAFRQNQYEGLLFGVVIKTGAGIMYSRDYNNLKELFKPRDKK